MRARLPTALAALVLALTACGGNGSPPDRIVFEHGPHLARGATCAECHAAAGAGTPGASAHPLPPLEVRQSAHPGSRAPSALERPLLPTEAECRTCHDDPAEDRCTRCHTSPERAGSYAMRTDDIRFDHAEHERAGQGRCVSCHGVGADTGSVLAFHPARPAMDTCTNACHRADMQAMRCDGCHTDLHRYRIDDVALVDHGPGFLRRHGEAARAGDALCATCHDPSFCEECHLSAPGLSLEALEPMLAHRDFVHRGDFLSRHGMEADLERGTCARCHGVSFCDGCHQQSGVGGGVAPGSPHPPGWLDPLSPFGHARAARRDMLSCVSCHEADAETTCVPCHRVGGVAGNPHPPGFGGGMDPMLHAVCRACHVEGWRR